MNLNHLTDSALLSETEKLVSQERELLVRVLHHLEEIERRRLFASLGFSSLFTYAVKRLGYSEDQAQRRISAMRLLRDLPELEDKVQNGFLSLTNLSRAQTLFRQEEKLAPLPKEQKKVILEKLESKTSREAEKILIQHSSEQLNNNQLQNAEKIKILGHDLIELRIVISEGLREKIETVKGLMAHSNPNMTLTELIDKLCNLGIEQWDPSMKKAGLKKVKREQGQQQKRPMEKKTLEVKATKAIEPNPALSANSEIVPPPAAEPVWKVA
jgi:hypothetical protein